MAGTARGSSASQSVKSKENVMNGFFPRTALAGLLLVLGSGATLAQSLEAIIDNAETTFGGEAFEAGRVGSFAEVQVLSGGQLIEAVYDFDTGQLLDSDNFGSPRLVQRIAAALDTAVLSLDEAIAAAEAAVASDDVLEALLLVSRRGAGRRFLIDIRTNDGVFDVIVDSQTGAILRIIRD